MTTKNPAAAAAAAAAATAAATATAAAAGTPRRGASSPNPNEAFPNEAVLQKVANNRKIKGVYAHLAAQNNIQAKRAPTPCANYIPQTKMALVTPRRKKKRISHFFWNGIYLCWEYVIRRELYINIAVGGPCKIYWSPCIV